jgi:2-polyprenyl-3-methyl-5-hydroxy-6-metoxy-1,4-benzoquinol methylase
MQMDRRANITTDRTDAHHQKISRIGSSGVLRAWQHAARRARIGRTAVWVMAPAAWAILAAAGRANRCSQDAGAESCRVWQQPWPYVVSASPSRAASSEPSRGRLIKAVIEKIKGLLSSSPHLPREPQLAFSELQAEMLNEAGRRQKAAKIISVLKHFLGRDDFSGMRALDIGSSTGFIADELSKAGAQVIGVDIDEPGLKEARARFGDKIEFLYAYGNDLPAESQSFDIIVFNQVYEHTVNPDAVMTEIRRVLRPDGAVYLGLGNRLGIMEPHYRLPFLSWLPQKAADRYIRVAGKAPTYYENFRTRRSLRRMCSGLNVWDYTYAVLAQSQEFAADDMVPRSLATAPALMWRCLGPIIPTFIWIGTLGPRKPAGPPTTVAPVLISSTPPAPAA